MIQTAPWKNRAASAREVVRRAADLDSNYATYAVSFKVNTSQEYAWCFFESQSINNVHVRVKSNPSNMTDHSLAPTGKALRSLGITTNLKPV